MKGQNHMILNHATMLEVVNAWFSSRTLYESNTVATRIKVLKDPLRFDITLESPGPNNPDIIEVDES